MLQTGTVLNNRYRVVDLLAEGGMARVYRAHDLILDRPVALKVLREQYAGDEAFLERFQREAKAAAALAHPNIVSIYDVGAEDGTNYIVMELVDGSNLKQIIQQEGPLSPSRALEIALPMLAALEFAHEREIVHRDVKPQNILVTSQGHVKVADFGIAQAAKASQHTETGVVMGSVHYCSPEQAMGKATTRASDVYSVGVVLYEMLTGHLPFDSDNAVGVALKHVQEPPPPLRLYNLHLSPGLESIVLKALSKEPAQRFGSAQEMAQVLQTYRRIGEQPTAAFTAVGTGREAQGAVMATAAPAVVVMPSMESRSAPTSRRPEGRRKGFDWLVVVFGLLILAMIVGWLPLAARLYDLYFKPVPTPAPRVIVTSPGQTPQATITPTPGLVTVPNLIGLTVTQAQQEMESRDLKITQSRDYSDSFQPDVVMLQSVAPDSTVAPGSTVAVVVSQGPRGIRVPPVVGTPIDAAMAKLKEAGLRGELRHEYDDRAALGVVVSQRPEAEQTVSLGAAVTLTVSLGPRLATPAAATPFPTPNKDGRVSVPNVVRLPEAQARSIIEAAGLQNTYTNYQELKDVEPGNRAHFNSIPVGAVVSQNPTAGQMVAVGTRVHIAVRKPD